MSRCAGCKYPVPVTEILCRRCLAEDEKVRWPACEQCHFQDATCGESGYRFCYPCHYAELALHYHSASLIQTAVRQHARPILKKKHKAAKHIQAVWRGHLTRSQLSLIL